MGTAAVCVGYAEVLFPQAGRRFKGLTENGVSELVVAVRVVVKVWLSARRRSLTDQRIS